MRYRQSKRTKMHKEPESQNPSDVLLKSDPIYTSPASKQAISDEINRRLQRKAFATVKQKHMAPNANILGGRPILAKKQLGNPN